MGYDSQVSPRALREIYLMPFMLAEKYAKPWSFMTALVFLRSTEIQACLTGKNLFHLDTTN